MAAVSPTPSAAGAGTGASEAQWTCTVCGELTEPGDRAQHVRQHLDAEEEEEEFVCEACGESLKDEEDLELHMAVEHDDEDEGDNQDRGSDDSQGQSGGEVGMEGQRGESGRSARRVWKVSQESLFITV